MVVPVGVTSVSVVVLEAVAAVYGLGTPMT